MPVIALIGLILTAIKIIIEIAKYLKDQPDLPPQTKRVIENIHKDAEVIYHDLREERNRIPEAP